MTQACPAYGHMPPINQIKGGGGKGAIYNATNEIQNILFLLMKKALVGA